MVGLTDRIKETTRKVAEAAGRPVEYLPSSTVRKEDYAREIADILTAQHLMDQQRRTRWAAAPNRITARVHQSHRKLFGETPLSHYWSADETKWATDVMFRSREDLAELYPRLVRQAMIGFSGNDVLRFLERRSQVHT